MVGVGQYRPDSQCGVSIGAALATCNTPAIASDSGTRRSWEQAAKFRGNEYGRDVFIVTGLVEVLQIQCIVPNLVDGVRREEFFVDFELHYKDYSVDYYNDIDSLAQTRYRVLKEDLPVTTVGFEYILENPNLLEPCIALRLLNSCTMANELAENLA
jgi:hypothetical protein